MKKFIVLFFAMALLASCVKQAHVDQPSDKWNGYDKFLKSGEQYHTLYAGRNIPIGTATYGIDENANFYVTYDCSATGWKMYETHMFAGDKKLMPVNKPGHPKVGQFPNSNCHYPSVSVYTYRVPLTSLPPCEEPGFVVAAHCAVISPCGQEESAWAEGDFKFTDKFWGWYDIYFYNQPPNEFKMLYGTGTDNGYLVLYQIDVTNNTSEAIWSEYVGSTGGSYDAAAYDVETSNLYFTNYETGQLWVNNLEDDLNSILCGTLSGTAQSATFYDGSYYYVKVETKSICRVDFNTDFTISAITALSTIPNSVTVSDIAMSPAGDCMYIIGDVTDGTGTQLIKWDIATNIYYTMSIDVEPGSKIAYGPDDELYCISEINTSTGESVAYIVDVATGVLTPIKDGVIIIDDPFSDLSSGRIM